MEEVVVAGQAEVKLGAKGHGNDPYEGLNKEQFKEHDGARRI